MNSSWVEMPHDYCVGVTTQELLKLATYHEVLHSFGLKHAMPPGPGDEGIMKYDNMFSGVDIELTPAQLNIIRRTWS